MSETTSVPVLETDFLKAIVDSKDRLHASAMKALERVKSKEWYVSSSALIELDLLLKISGIGIEDRSLVFETLRSELPGEMIAPVVHESVWQAIRLQSKYGRLGSFYFDSIHLAVAIEVDGQIVSSDRSFDGVVEVRRLPLERL